MEKSINRWTFGWFYNYDNYHFSATIHAFLELWVHKGCKKNVGSGISQDPATEVTHLELNQPPVLSSVINTSTYFCFKLTPTYIIIFHHLQLYRYIPETYVLLGNIETYTIATQTTPHPTLTPIDLEIFIVKIFSWFA